MPVGAHPFEGHEDPTRLHLSGVISHPGDDEIFVTLDAAALQAGQEALDSYGGRMVAVHAALAD